MFPCFMIVKLFLLLFLILYGANVLHPGTKCFKYTCFTQPMCKWKVVTVIHKVLYGCSCHRECFFLVVKQIVEELRSGVTNLFVPYKDICSYITADTAIASKIYFENFYTHTNTVEPHVRKITFSLKNYIICFPHHIAYEGLLHAMFDMHIQGLLVPDF